MKNYITLNKKSKQKINNALDKTPDIHKISYNLAKVIIAKYNVISDEILIFNHAIYHREYLKYVIEYLRKKYKIYDI